MFEYPLLSNAIYNSEGKLIRYGYSDGETIQIFAEHLNFTPVFITRDDTKFGQQLKNGTFTGALAAVEYGECDISGNSIVVTIFNATKTLYLRTISSGKFYFVIPKPETSKELLKSLSASFDTASKCFAGALILFFLSFYPWFMKIETGIFDQRKKISTQRSILIIFGIIFNVSAKLPSLNSSRLFLAAVLFYSLVISTLFQSTIVKNLNANIVMGDITTLNELLDYNYRMILPDQLSAIFRNYDGSKFARKLRKVAENGSCINSCTIGNVIENIKVDKKVAILMSDFTIGKYLDQYYDNVTKINLFSTVPEFVYQFYVSLLVPKNSPFQDHFNEIIQMMTEAGIFQYQYSVALQDNNKFMIKRVKEGEIPQKESKSIKFSDLQSVFSIYLLLNVFAILIFFVEILFNLFLRKVKIKNFQEKNVKKKSGRNKTQLPFIQ